MTRSITRRMTHRSRRLPWWIRRSVRAWARCARWMGGQRTASGVRQAHAAERADDELPMPPADERRCGWFDSSQDLREGLCISEHASGDAVAAQLPVMAWVQLQLSGWRPRLDAAQTQPAR